MTPQLYSIEHVPLHLPYWRTMMDDLCNPTPAAIAQVLGLGLRTVERYNATGHAPRHVCLAVFWLTSWGRSAVHAQATLRPHRASQRASSQSPRATASLTHPIRSSTVR